jgi:hypothetical protein
VRRKGSKWASEVSQNKSIYAAEMGLKMTKEKESWIARAQKSLLLTPIWV